MYASLEFDRKSRDRPQKFREEYLYTDEIQIHLDQSHLDPKHLGKRVNGGHVLDASGKGLLVLVNHVTHDSSSKMN